MAGSTPSQARTGSLSLSLGGISEAPLLFSWCGPWGACPKARVDEVDGVTGNGTHTL